MQNSTEKTLITFHTGRGGRFNNGGYTQYVNQDKSISTYTDDLFSGFENTYEVIKEIGERENLLKLVEEAQEESNTESPAYLRLKSMGLDLGELYYFTEGNANTGCAVNNDGTGTINEDGQYDTTKVIRLEDCTEDQLQMIVDSNNWKSSDVLDFCSKKLELI